LTFDHVTHAVDGCGTGVVMKALNAEQANDGFAHALNSNKRINNINHSHELFVGPCGEETHKTTVKVRLLEYLKLVRNVQPPRHDGNT
jgi:hypothetical protein